MCWLADLGHHEGRQRYAREPQFEQPLVTYLAEFSGTLMGFDDFVSQYISSSINFAAPLTR